MKQKETLHGFAIFDCIFGLVSVCILGCFDITAMLYSGVAESENCDGSIATTEAALCACAGNWSLSAFNIIDALSRNHSTRLALDRRRV